MRACDLCSNEPVGRAGFLGGRSERRIWLCSECFRRFEEHELEPMELARLTRLAGAREGKCEWCTSQPPSTQVRVVGSDGKRFAFQLCASCALSAQEEDRGEILHAEAALASQTTTDPRYEKARQVWLRRKSLRRIK